MKNKVLIIIVFLVSVSLIFSSCSSGVKNASSAPMNINNISNASSKDIVQSPQRDKPDETKRKVIESWEEYEASDLPLISAVHDRNMYLYAVKPNGVILYIEGKGHYFDWAYMTPRFILPRMNVGDYDNDGKDELSVILYVGSGTGYAVEDLHIIELSEKEIISEDPSNKDYFVPNPEYFKDNFYKPDDYLKQINKLVKLKTYYRNGELKGNVSVGKQSYVISLKDLQSISDKVTVAGVSFGDIVKFNAKDKRLTVQMALGITTRSFATPFYVGDVYADVEYKAGKFTMSNLRFMEEKD